MTANSTPEHLAWIASSEIAAHRWPGLTHAAVRAELARESSLRANAYPDWIGKGRMTRDEADYQQAVFTAIAADWQQAMDNRGEDPAGHAFTHPERRRAVLRELEYRNSFYPLWVDKGRMTRDQQIHRIAALEAVLDLYDQGWGWQAANGTPCNWASPAPTPGERQARDQWRDFAASLAQQQNAAQPALAL